MHWRLQRKEKKENVEQRTILYDSSCYLDNKHYYIFADISSKSKKKKDIHKEKGAKKKEYNVIRSKYLKDNSVRKDL